MRTSSLILSSLVANMFFSGVSAKMPCHTSCEAPDGHVRESFDTCCDPRKGYTLGEEGMCVRSDGTKCRVRGCRGTLDDVCETAPLLEFAASSAPTLDNGQPVGLFGKPSSALSLGWLADGAPAWQANGLGNKQAPASHFTRVDPRQSFLHMSVPSYVLAKGHKQVMGCPANLAGHTAACEFWVFFYSCPWSCTAKYQGGVPATLAQMGWTYSVCAPHFKTDAATPEFQHQMRSYRIQIRPGDESQEFVVPENAEFLAFGSQWSDVYCEDLDETQCNANSETCKWYSDRGECGVSDCKRNLQGPPPPCLECPWEGFIKRPDEDGPFYLHGTR